MCEAEDMSPQEISRCLSKTLLAGCIGLYFLDTVGYGNCCVELGQNMDVIRDSAGLQQTPFLGAQYTTRIGVQFFTDLGFEGRRNSHLWWIVYPGFRPPDSRGTPPWASHRPSLKGLRVLTFVKACD
jgi:hypothetical protein